MFVKSHCVPERVLVSGVWTLIGHILLSRAQNLIATQAYKKKDFRRKMGCFWFYLGRPQREFLKGVLANELVCGAEGLLRKGDEHKLPVTNLKCHSPSGSHTGLGGAGAWIVLKAVRRQEPTVERPPRSLPRNSLYTLPGSYIFILRTPSH